MYNPNIAIILDLDDTIFKTKSMDPKVFEQFFKHFACNLKAQFNQAEIESILDDLWESPWDEVIRKYAIPIPVVTDSLKILDNLELNLNISTYEDYCFVKIIPVPKYLVTTSLTSLQKTKIKALKIENDFVKIVIIDTFIEPKTKLDIFRELMMEYNLIPETTFVIGDNANSEIEAGNYLNMVTIQILREGVTKGNNARHYINSFQDLCQIINIEL